MRPLLNKALLWKEWRQNRGYFLLAGLLLTYVPVLKSLYFLVSGSAAVSEWGNHLNHMMHFQQGMANPAGYSAVMETWGMVVVILLGALMLGEERKGSLNYLASTPVSRRQIILAKFLAGSGVILLAMMVNSGFLMGMDFLLELPYTGLDVLNWAVLTSFVFLGMYTLTLMTSTFTANVLAAGGLSFGLMFLPRVVVSLIAISAYRYFSASQSFLIKAHYLGSYLTLTDYLTRFGRDGIITSIEVHGSFTAVASSGSVALNIGNEGLFLIFGILFLLFLAVVIFERDSLEPGGTIFASRSARRCCEIVVTLLLGWGLALSWATSLGEFCLYVAGFSLVVLVLLELFYRAGRYGSFFKPDL